MWIFVEVEWARFPQKMLVVQAVLEVLEALEELEVLQASPVPT